jgi:hypothetical protein
MNDFTYGLAQNLQQALDQQRQAYLAHPVPTLQERIADLRTLQRFVREHKDALCDAISADYGHRSRHETLLAEIVPAVDGIDHVIRHLRRWMRPQRRSVDLRSFFGARNRVIPQPLGVVGVIVPWNFPINLSMVPLTYIFAAGNRAMVKMSENSRALSLLLIERMPAYFPPEKLQFFEETGGVGIAFSKLPFDHLLFTGSGTTGRAVMAAAAENLCPVTLELGGKCPAIVCDDFPLQQAAERILFVKYLNACSSSPASTPPSCTSKRRDADARRARCTSVRAAGRATRAASSPRCASTCRAAAGHAGCCGAPVVDAAEPGQPGLGGCRARPARSTSSRSSCPQGRDGLPELEAEVGRLHPVLLDRKRPLWKMHVFEGLAPGPRAQARRRSTRSCTTPRSTARPPWRWPTRCSTSRPSRVRLELKPSRAEGLPARHDRDAARRARQPGAEGGADHPRAAVAPWAR